MLSATNGAPHSHHKCSSMKKQINPTIKAHLIRSAFYVTLLLAVCVIPFALAQRNTTKHSAAPKGGLVGAANGKAAAGAPNAAVPSTGAATALDKQAISKIRQAALAPRKTSGAPASLAGATAQRRGPAMPRSHAGLAAGFPTAPNLSPWNIVANYPFASESVSVSSDGTVAYAVGGFDPNIGPTNAFNMYDPVADTWTPLPNVPGAFYDAPSAYDPTTNSVYVFGGIDAGFNPSNVVQIYNVGTGIWTTGTPMPGARYFAGAAYYAANGKIYVISGFDQNFLETSTTWQYDPVANAWDTTRANMPAPTGGAGYSIVGQNIYLAGTWNGANGSTQHYRYDIVADAWTAVAPVPVNIYRPDSAAIGTNTYLVGGGNPFLGSRGFKGPKVLHPSTNSPETSY